MFAKAHGMFLAAALAALAGCVDTGTATAPTKAPGAASGAGPDTGIGKNALVGVAGISDLGGTRLYGIFYIAAKADPAQLKAAPGKLCASQGLSLVSAEDAALEHPEQLPGVRKLMVRCK